MTLGSKSYLKLLSPWIIVNVAVPLSLILQPAAIAVTSQVKIILTNLRPQHQKKDRLFYHYMKQQRRQKSDI